MLVLRTNATSLDALSKSVNPDGKYSAFCDEAAATNQPLSALAEELEISSAKPVLDETRLTNHCDFDIKWKQKDYSHPNIAGMIAAVKSLGLELVPEKKSMEVVVVSKVPWRSDQLVFLKWKFGVRPVWMAAIVVLNAPSFI